MVMAASTPRDEGQTTQAATSGARPMASEVSEKAWRTALKPASSFPEMLKYPEST